MITRRRLIVGSAGLLSAMTASLGATAAAAANGRPIAAQLPARAASGFQLPGGLFCPVPYLSRSAWGADESLRYSNNGGYWPEEYFPVQTITVHHTGFAAKPDPAQTVRDIYVRQTLYGDGSAGAIGWGDIGYHLLIDDQGVVYEGRFSGSDGKPVFNGSGHAVTAAHIGRHNPANIGVCLIGYLVDTPATAAARQSLVTVLAYLAAVGGVNPTATVKYVNPAPGYQQYTKTVLGVSGHRNWAATECPGGAFYALLGGIRTAAAAAMPTSEPAPPTTTEPAPTQTGGQPTPSGSEPPTTPPTATSTGTPTTATTTKPATTAPTTTAPAQTKPRVRDRGGDEYVPVARSASPSAFPTKRPVATPSASPTSSPTSMPTTTPSPTSAPLAGYVSTSASGPGWGVGATVVGVTAAGVAGAVWLRQRRSAPSSAPTVDSSTAAATATPGVGLEVTPAPPDDAADTIQP